MVRAAIAAQVGATLTFAPDFQIKSIDDPWLEVNLRCLRLTLALARGRRVAAWIHVTLETMLSGALPAIAARYAEELPSGSSVVLTVSDLRSDLAADQLAAYFRALAALRSAGFQLVVDRASDVSIAAVASYADGCMLGTRLYRTAPPSPIFASEINPKIPLAYYVGHQGRRVRRDVANRRHRAGGLRACAHPGCRAVSATRRKDNVLVRLHNAHEIRNEIRRARHLGIDLLIASWRDAPLKHLRTWAQALEEANARRDEA